MSTTTELILKSVFSFSSRFKVIATIISELLSRYGEVSNDKEIKLFQQKSRKKLKDHYICRIVPIIEKTGMEYGEAKAIALQIFEEDVHYLVRYSREAISLDELEKEMKEKISSSSPYEVESSPPAITGEVLHALDGVTETAQAVVVSPLSTEESIEIIAKILIMQMYLDEKEWRNDLASFLESRKDFLRIEGNSGERIKEFLAWFEMNFKKHLPPHDDCPF